jgi:maltose alpha-D-glucosyltransferase/alpha-amylase
VLGFVRQLADDRVLCVNNLSKRAQPVELDLSPFNGLKPFELLGGNEFPRIGELPYFITLAPYSFFWFALR